MALDLPSQSSVKAFQMKGSLYTLTTLELHVSDISMIRSQLQAMTQKAPKFFQQTPVVIALDRLGSGKNNFDMPALRRLMHDFGIMLIAISGGTDIHRKNAANCGIAWLSCSKPSSEDTNSYDNSTANVVRITKHRDSTSTESSVQAEEKKQVIDATTKIIERPVRSGQQERSTGDLVVLGSVSAGSELLAVGHIHVYGHLRGRALAGINGNQDARIFCRQFEPELISICGQYKLPNHADKSRWGQSVLISLKDQYLHIKEL